jgi:D-alanyl-D-alanine carboxypeptidase (penicillin-binding protein 5/6)
VNRSPFMSSGGARPRREAVRRRRRRRALGTVLLALGVLLGAAAITLVLAVGRTGGGGPARGGSTRIAAPGRPAQAPPARSPLGLPLGAPPLRLGLSDAAAVAPRFGRHPPRAGLLFNLRTGRVLWQRDAVARLRIASLTKMMTALLVVEHSPRHDSAQVTRQAVHFQGSGVGLLPYGRQVPVDALLAGLLLPSGNDAAIALAQHVSGSVARFVRLMNVRAAQLGLGCSRFSSPSGFYDQGNFSCAADLALLAVADLGQPRIEQLSSRASVALPFPIKGGRLYLVNNNPLVLEGYPGITGLKTGYTSSAGRCLVATARRGGVSLGVVLLDSPDPAAQARQLLDRGFGGTYHPRGHFAAGGAPGRTAAPDSVPARS